MKPIHRLAALCIALLAAPAPAQERGGPIPDYPAEKVAEGVFVIHGPLSLPTPENQGFMNNPAFVLTPAGVVVVDPGSSIQAGEMVLRVLAKHTTAPVVAVFNTHVHGDHWLGNDAIAAAYPDAAIYAHPRMIEAARNGAGEYWVSLMEELSDGATRGTSVVLPARAVEDGDVIEVGGLHFAVHHHGKSHTPSDIMIEVQERETVFLGDNVLNKRLPRISDGNVAGNIGTIDEVMTLGSKTYVPGHGQTGGLEAVKIYRAYLQGLYDVVKQGFDDGLESFEITDKAREALADYRDWSGFEDEIGRHVSIAYLQIEEAEF